MTVCLIYAISDSKSCTFAVISLVATWPYVLNADLLPVVLFRSVHRLQHRGQRSAKPAHAGGSDSRPAGLGLVSLRAADGADGGCAHRTWHLALPALRARAGQRAVTWHAGQPAGDSVPGVPSRGGGQGPVLGQADPGLDSVTHKTPATMNIQSSESCVIEEVNDLGSSPWWSIRSLRTPTESNGKQHWTNRRSRTGWRRL